MLTMKTYGKVKTVIKKTVRAGLAHAEVGDIYEFSCDVKKAGSNGHSTYATYVKLKNTRNGEEGWYSFNEMNTVFSIIEFEEVNNTNESEEEKPMKAKIEIVNQDLFTVPQGYYLAHCISSDFALGAGIAKKFNEVYDMRKKLEKQFNFNNDYCWEDRGEAILVDNVFNLVTKNRYYDKPTYNALTQALSEMRDKMEMWGITKLAMPKIGCGLDKLDWDTVYGIIEEVFGDMDVEILICTID